MSVHLDKYELLESNSKELYEIDDFFSTFVHVKYYSVIQYFHHLFISNGFYRDYNHLFNSRQKGTGLHKFLINEFRKKFINPNNSHRLLEEELEIDTAFYKLISYRTKADYSDSTMVGYVEDDKKEILNKFNEFLENVKSYE